MFIQSIKNQNDLNGLAKNEFQAIFDFILNQDYSHANDYYDPQNHEKQENLQITVKVSIDILTIVFLHIIVQ